MPGIPVLFERLLGGLNTADWVNGLVLDGIVGGVGAVLGFVPQILILFLFLAFLESCGYMARIAFIMDRIFRKFGLSGKSFIPMLIGTGCGIPVSYTHLIGSAKMNNVEEMRRLVMMDMMIVLLSPRCTRSVSLAPMFWLMKEDRPAW